MSTASDDDLEKLIASFPPTYCAICGVHLEGVKMAPGPDYCVACVRQKHLVERANADAPVYDIDEILKSGSSQGVVDEIHSKVLSDSDHRDIAWNRLLHPEVICRAFTNFDNLMGNGFSSLIYYGGGPEIFIRGHHALQSIGANDCVAVTTAVKEIYENAGIAFPDQVPQDWWPSNNEISPEIYDKIINQFEELDERYWAASRTVYDLIVDLLRANIDILRSRKPSNI